MARNEPGRDRDANHTPDRAEPPVAEDAEQSVDADDSDLIAHGLPDGEELPWTICGSNAAVAPSED